MNIHNIMEEYVSSTVNELYDTLKSENIKWLSCDCKTCRLDTVCFVLNRIKPRYIVSERGVLHNSIDLDDVQLKADLSKLALEGIRLINGSQRKFHNSDTSKNISKFDGKPNFNLPLLIGQVFDGTTFEPLEGVVITIKNNNELIEMFDSTWSNPTETFKATNGAYSFWPKPVPGKEGDTKDFSFVLEFKKEGYAPITYCVDIPAKATIDAPSTNYSLKIRDIFMFSEDVDNPMEG